MARFAGRDELFKAAASNDVDFLTSHVQLPSDPASPSSSHASSASSPGTELASAEGQKTSQSGKKLDAEDLNALEDEDGRSLLHVACAAGHLQAVECLLRAGAGFLKADEGGWTPLLSASSAGHLPVVEALIEAARTRQASGPAAQADLQPNREIVKELLEAKTPSGGTALTTAAAKGHKAVVEALLDAGAEIEATDNYGRTALSKAVVASKEAVVEVLMHRGASVQVHEKFTGDNLLHLAVHADLCLLLMRTDPELRFQKNREGVTPFEAGRAPFLKHVATLYEEERGENAEGSATTDLKETE
uniref:Ankyrin repeat-containing protein n=1 Tax=Neospora caninum (strain Liverpool) TaxID=572307 RepID=A0A0F7UPQ6_NEOCL|nr:TPA: ankyrin repeat-containing protein [Neospora caninum Liverpool]